MSDAEAQAPEGDSKAAVEEGGKKEGNEQEEGPMVLNLPSDLKEKNNKKWLIESTGGHLTIPDTYKFNTLQEEETLEVVEDFRRQFIQLFPNRRPLLLFPTNECGVQKFISTTVSPTLEPYPELYDLGACATFVSNYLQYSKLDNPVKLPTIVPASRTVLELRAGDCFDFSILLVSLLKGCEYNAYCISGYAPKWITEVDLTSTYCPERIKFPDEPRNKPKKDDNSGENDRYLLKDLKQHKSIYEISKTNKDNEMKKRLVDRAKAEALAKIEKEVDKYATDRIHCWVLVKANRRDIKEDVFVEASTGIIYPVKESPYVGIETIWDDTNCWVNMQGSKTMEVSLDISEKKCWENVMITKPPPSNNDASARGMTGNRSPSKSPTAKDGAASPAKSRPGTASLKSRKGSKQEGKQDGQGAASRAEKAENVGAADLDTLDVPRSWALPPTITKENYRSRYPKFCKTINYRDCKVELFEEYKNETAGLVQRVSIYEYNEDNVPMPVEKIIEHFRFRKDKMRKRVTFVKTGKTVTYFDKGCEMLMALKEYTVEGNTEIYVFFPGERKDGMLQRTAKRAKKGTVRVVELFSNRDDRLIQRETTLKDVNPSEETKSLYVLESRNKEVTLCKIREKFSRDEAKDADEDVEVRTHWIEPVKREVMLEFHLRKTSIIRKCLVYNLDMEFKKLLATHPMHKCPPDKMPTQNESLKQLALLAQKEKDVFQDVRDREEKADHLDMVLEEFANNIELEQDLHDKAQEASEKIEDEMEIGLEDQDSEREKPDFLQPFLDANFGGALPKNKSQVAAVKSECLAALKERLLERATIIQDHLDREQAALNRLTELNRMQGENQEEKKKAEENKEMSDLIMFRLSILDARLKRHEKMAIKKYTELTNDLEERLSKVVGK
uniref:Dynein regulatory complex subunit 7 n=1 Tax=Lotharella globosa TaxID=91324 RepID=A0A7S3YRW2_9EUKA